MSDTAHYAGKSPVQKQKARCRPNPPVNRVSAKSHAAASRCEAMIDRARAQIMAVGVDRFNVNEVLRQAGGSKATLAKYFGDRTGLIAAAIGAEARSAMAPIGFDATPPHSLPLCEALECALGGVLRFYLTPGALSLYRAVIGAANGDPRGAAAFYHEGHAVVVGTIARLLEDRKGHDVRADLDSKDVADQLVHAIRAGLYKRALIGIDQPPFDESEISGRIATTLALILPGLALHVAP